MIAAGITPEQKALSRIVKSVRCHPDTMPVFHEAETAEQVSIFGIELIESEYVPPDLVVWTFDDGRVECHRLGE